MATRAACRHCAKRLPATWGVCAGPTPTLSTCSCAPASCKGFSLLCRALRGHGVEQVALEDPGWHLHRLIVEQAGLEVVPIPVDEGGLRVDALAATEASAVLLTPAHQFPTGAVLAPERRAALIEWAEDERLIVEDDYDSEFRYDRVAVGALQGLAPEQIVYIGSASKRLAPAMRLGWMLLPSWLTWELTAAKTIEDCGSEVVGQLALRDFIARGELDRHVRRMRLRYQRRREALLEAAGALAARRARERRRRRTVRARAAARGGRRVAAASCGRQAWRGCRGAGAAPLRGRWAAGLAARLRQPLRAGDRARCAAARRGLQRRR